jgi:hypothetical protein
MLHTTFTAAYRRNFAFQTKKGIQNSCNGIEAAMLVS